MKVTVVTGPPAGGKTTHVREHAAPGDVVVDLDALAVALSAHPDEDPHDYPAHIRDAAVGARTAALHRAARSHATAHVWLIHAQPTTAQAVEYQALGYDVVVVDPGQDVVMARCAASRPPIAMVWARKWYATQPPQNSARVAALLRGRGV